MYTLVLVLRTIRLITRVHLYQFVPRDGLPDVSGSLSGNIPSRAIARVNKEVARILNTMKKAEQGLQANNEYYSLP